MSKLYRFIAIAFAYAGLICLAPLVPIAQAVAYIAPMLFGPVEARLSLALDMLAGIVITDPVGRARHTAFLTRANAHPEFIGGRFAAG
jgi:hypothetical protein